MTMLDDPAGQHSRTTDACPEGNESAPSTASALAFLILAHADPAQVDRLLCALPPDSHKLVHIDRKSTQFDGFSPTSRNTQLADPRRDVYWAGFSIIEATLQLLRLALATTAADRLILLSGNCYPIKSNEEILAFFASDQTREYINYYDVNTASDLYKNKLRKIFISEDVIARKTYIASPGILKCLSRVASRAVSLAERDWQGMLNGLVPAFGSQWWALTRPCAEKIVDAAATRPELSIYQFTFAPDEMYFHTIVANSRFHDRAGGFHPFQGRGNWKIANLHLISQTSLRKIYTMQDWDEIARSDRLFVRKLTSHASGELMTRIDSELRN